MKILSWNVNNDYRNIKNKVDIIIKLLNKFDIDIIGLQEVIPEL